MSSIFSPPYSPRLFYNHAAFYALIQVIIWIKVAIFFSLYGHGYFVAGTFAPFIAPQLFTVPHLLFDYIFHQVMHLLIFVALLLFARRIKQPNNLQLAVFFAVAVFLHNVGYWFTNVFDTLPALLADAALDFAALFILFYLIRVAMQNNTMAKLVNFSKQ